MTISYNWLSEYIPEAIVPEKISVILTSIGLEVESLERFESIKGNLAGLVVGEVKECIQHPGADKLKLTKVDVGENGLLQIVCGAPNVAVGQKVIVAKIGTTIHPLKGEAITMKKAKIRGEESWGMICAEDEVGLGTSHDGIVVLPSTLIPGTPLSDHYRPYTDHIYEIGLTPNRMDAMSHLGVARDVCAYLSHHEQKNITVKIPQSRFFNQTDRPSFEVEILNRSACQRYCGINLTNVTVAESPAWLQHKLRSIGQRPINNIVDITNFILHDTGQPLHAFDADRIEGRKIIVTNLPEGTPFLALDDRERKLSSDDLMICDGNKKSLCIAGVFGGAGSGVNATTKNIFLESAWFNPVDIRKTSFRHGLRTDAAARFEKNVDISNTLNVLQRAAALMIEIAGGEIASKPVDVYPQPAAKKELTLQYDFLKKLSGKDYQPDTVNSILRSLGFETAAQTKDGIDLKVPYSKPDITLQADIIEEVMRIDGYDNIAIPTSITISPASGAINPGHLRKEKTASYLVGAGFNEIFTNSITNAAYFEEGELGHSVRLLNNLSAVHNIMRPSMLETGLESVAYNLNRKNSNLRFFEFGKRYGKAGEGKYSEEEHLCLYVTGSHPGSTWKSKPAQSDIYYLKGVATAVFDLLGLKSRSWEPSSHPKLKSCILLKSGRQLIAELGIVNKQELSRFDVKQEVFFADINWQSVQDILVNESISFRELPNQLPVFRDLAMVVDKSISYQSVEATINKIGLEKLESIKLFDVFESEKLGKNKKSLAISITFLDEEKTLTDKEIDGMMKKIMQRLEQDISAEIRKGA